MRVPETAVPVAQQDNFWLGQSAGDKATATQIAEAKGKALVQIPKLQSTLRSMEAELTRSEKFLDKAEKIVETWDPSVVASVYRLFSEKIPGTEAKDVANLLLPVKSNIFVQTLNEMRQNSPTGGAVGNVTDVEGEKLQSTLGSLATDQSPEQLLENMKLVRAARREIYENLKKTLEGYESYLKGTPAAGGAPAAPSAFEAARARYK